MNTAVKLNKLMRERSMNADLVMVNCPSVPTDTNGQSNYVAFLDVRTRVIGFAVCNFTR